MPTFVRFVRTAFSVAVCCSAAFADVHPGRSSPVVEVRDRVVTDAQRALDDKTPFVLPKLALLVPDFAVRGKSPELQVEPFDMSAKAIPPVDMVAKWDALQLRILADKKAIAACRSDEATCSPAARRFLALVELGDRRDRRAQLGWLNRAVNLAIRPESDSVQYGETDFWASPLQTLASGAGDCEDYAIVKYVALRELGFADSEVRFVVVRDDKHGVEHAIIAVRDDREWLILDNRTMAILSSADIPYYIPLFAFDQQGTQTVAIADHVTDR